MDWLAISNYGGFFLGFIGVILSIYLYYKGKEGKEPVFFYLTFQDIRKLDNENSKIKVFYNSEEVKQVITTYFWIWNRGRRPINKSDIPSQTPIIIKIKDNNKDIKILDWQVLRTSREVLNLNVERYNDSALTINFDFLDYNDGGVIEFQHTGDSDTGFDVQGVILGSPEGIKRIVAKITLEFFGIKLKVGTYTANSRQFTRKNSYSLLKLLSLSVIFSPWLVISYAYLVGKFSNFPTSIILIILIPSILILLAWTQTSDDFPYPNSVSLNDRNK